MPTPTIFDYIKTAAQTVEGEIQPELSAVESKLKTVETEFVNSLLTRISLLESQVTNLIVVIESRIGEKFNSLLQAVQQKVDTSTQQ